MRTTNRLTRLLGASIAICALMLALGRSDAATEISGVKFEDTAKVGNSELALNGAGVRVKSNFKLYAAGLYLTAKKTTLADIVALEGPKRLQIVMMRDISGDGLGGEVIKALTDNLDDTERAKLVSQTASFTELFGSGRTFKKGDVLIFDWLPGTGMQAHLNGKAVGQTIADGAFFHAVLRVWLGKREVDRSLKTKLLGAKA